MGGWFEDFFGSATKTLGQEFWPAAIMTGGSLVGNMLQNPEDSLAYGQTQAGFEANLAAEKELQAMQIAASKEIAAMNAASAGKGAGAAIAAANIAKDSAMRQMLMKAHADALAYKLDAKKSGMEALQRARENMLATKLKQAELSGVLYTSAGNALMGMAR